MSGRPQKDFHEYLAEPSTAYVGHEDYLTAPAIAFLKYAIEAKCTVDLCIRKFPKQNSRKYTKDSADSLQHLVSAMLPSLMGHFETFQRYLFAGTFDRSVYLQDFDAEKFFKTLSKDVQVSFDPVRLAAHRHLGVTSVGLLLADSLSGWHNPNKVNSFFNAFSLQRQLFNSDHCAKLAVLWQLRHSIVHTGGTLTLPDAQKVPALSKLGDKKVVFEKHFIFEVARKLHPLVKEATEGIGTAFQSKIISGIDVQAQKDIDEFFKVKSSIGAWLR
ncbi:MAG: hypothetical protein KME07_08440 [Pegethrix bostrychoides GSE-TBD4-15B]|jgi:hypothetical protein|uniref:Uncharacterized protein n=1 Tax=Pegethrix bostrychoides GSE-TBD4-15B TaxID=2839662 RepID=A0A951PAP8_9CYAN|nr:hypothetical protein [Pegethrix bostrychoides GSE-TBD4-15B]